MKKIRQTNLNNLNSILEFKLYDFQKEIKINNKKIWVE